MTNFSRTCDLLIVDDDPAQARLFEMVLQDIGCLHRCHAVANGKDALDFVRRKPPYESAPRPDLIILDRQMPGLDGCAVLREIKADPDLKRIPVVMFSGGGSAEAFEDCYKDHANACVRKPLDYEANLSVVRAIEQFWLGTVELPRP